MVSIASGSVGGQYLSGLPVSDEATFTTTTSGPWTAHSSQALCVRGGGEIV
jgi:hypothetical protein